MIRTFQHKGFLDMRTYLDELSDSTGLTVLPVICEAANPTVKVPCCKRHIAADTVIDIRPLAWANEVMCTACLNLAVSTGVITRASLETALA